MPVIVNERLKKYTTYFDPEQSGTFAKSEILSIVNRSDLLSYDFRLKYNEYCSNFKYNLFLTQINIAQIPPYHSHDFYEFNVVLSGELMQYVDGEFLNMSAGDIIIFSPVNKHTICCNKNTVAYNILVTKDYIDAFYSELDWHVGASNNIYSRLIKKNNYLFVSMGNHGILTPLMIELIERCKTVSPRPLTFGFKTQTLLTNFLIELNEAVNAKTVLGINIPGSSVSNQEKILKYIDENYTTVTLDKLSEHFHCSRTYIYSYIKKMTGMSYSLYIILLRMKDAKYLLENTSYPIGKICELVGLHSNEHFCRMFKKQEGITPLEYRKKMSTPPPQMKHN